MYGRLPMTGLGALTVGGLAFEFPALAAISAALIVGGFALMRRARPTRP